MAGLPEALRTALHALAAEADAARLLQDARALSEAYRLRTGSGERLATSPGEAAAYALSRMPATYAAVRAALSEALAAADCRPTTLLDCGAGTGAASWAADALLPLSRATLLEREASMRGVGRRLLSFGGDALRGAEWIKGDALTAALPRAGLVVEGYMLGELPEESRVPAALRLYEAAEELLLLVEPGTPRGFANLAAVREALISRGARIAAPCPAGAERCPMAGEDWCHFAVRVERGRLHKALKGGEAPYEDEKFCYLAAVRGSASPAGARVLRHPQIAPGRVTLALCEGGRRTERAVTKKDPLWKRARKLKAGAAL